MGCAGRHCGPARRPTRTPRRWRSCHELAELEPGGFWRRRSRRLPDPARAIEAALADFGPPPSSPDEVAQPGTITSVTGEVARS
jgi:hypothetical protein